MVPELLALALILAYVPARICGDVMSTLTLQGRLVVVDVDYHDSSEPAVDNARFRDTHFVLRDSSGHVWPLHFPDGNKPPQRFGSGVQVEVQVATSQDAVSAAAAGTVADPSSQAGAGQGSGKATRRRLLDSAGSKPHVTGDLRLRGRRMGPSGPSATKVQQHQRHTARTSETVLHSGSHNRSRTAANSTGPTARHRLQEAITHQAHLATAPRRSLTVLDWRLLDPQQPASSSSSSVATAGVVNVRDAELSSDDSVSFSYNSQRLVMDDVSTVIFILDMCGKGPAMSVEELEDVLFDRANNNLQSYMSSCSYGRTRFNRDNVLILGPVPLDCSGTTWDYYGWRTDSCQEGDYWGWQFAAEDWADQNGIDISAYRHRVVVTSANKREWMVNGDVDCSWTGLGSIGPVDNSSHNLDRTVESPPYWPGVYSYAWLSGDHWANPQAWLHELGHNYYLRHAATSECEYCDDTCAMGFCCTSRCFNAPHMWQVGWDSPAQTLDSSSLRPGQTVGLNLKYQRRTTPPATSSGSFMRINAAWAAAGDGAESGISPPSIWVGYRQSADSYDILPADLNSNVSIYWYPGASPLDATVSVRLASLAPGGTWRSSSPLNLSVLWTARVSVKTSVRADLKVCRFTDTVENVADTCWDGLDNDCDGLVDFDDPDCSYDYSSPPVQISSTSPPPPPPIPSSPPPPQQVPPPPPPPPSPPPPPLPTTTSIPGSPTWTGERPAPPPASIPLPDTPVAINLPPAYSGGEATSPTPSPTLQPLRQPPAMPSHNGLTNPPPLATPATPAPSSPATGGRSGQATTDPTPEPVDLTPVSSPGGSSSANSPTGTTDGASHPSPQPSPAPAVVVPPSAVPTMEQAPPPVYGLAKRGKR
ncbi:hypothetical protein Agub_g10447 [Astrephomene gubernaculifera]|uniref:Peptidase M11 gametolysin domain-containing protein n=1 Tax=Astrephomene gubernaculifera TaxID=47775 RepID=A0AAD3DXR3_9CHLO|nr:hypothetical protein Agub_g10447 [Astrephomene gubernaculifera]